MSRPHHHLCARSLEGQTRALPDGKWFEVGCTGLAWIWAATPPLWVHGTACKGAGHVWYNKLPKWLQNWTVFSQMSEMWQRLYNHLLKGLCLLSVMKLFPNAVGLAVNFIFPDFSEKKNMSLPVAAAAQTSLLIPHCTKSDVASLKAQIIQVKDL